VLSQAHDQDKGMNLVGEIYPWYSGPPIMAQNSGYDRFPPAANGWRTIHPVPGNDPTNLG
jgi:hypothetical protein